MRYERTRPYWIHIFVRIRDYSSEEYKEIRIKSYEPNFSLSDEFYFVKDESGKTIKIPATGEPGAYHYLNTDYRPEMVYIPQVSLLERLGKFSD
jgi:hypothetical protein